MSLVPCERERCKAGVGGAQFGVLWCCVGGVFCFCFSLCSQDDEFHSHTIQQRLGLRKHHNTTTITAVGRRTVRGRRRGRSRCLRAPTLRRLAANIEVE